MPDLFVQRGSGLLRGDDIVDPLLTTVEACLARGRVELDEQSSGMQEVEKVVQYRPGFRAGQVIQGQDLLTGQIWYGKIIGLSFQYGDTDVTVTLSIKRPSVTA